MHGLIHSGSRFGLQNRVLTLAAAVEPLFLEAGSAIETVLWRRTPAWPESGNFF